ncbi:uncharacterized protein [Apostichopus japonicus]|uniref:uncharacterized protein n=1 Tax=Stichopus japonicus TaxID=307972 RepID=UPI003AB90C3F
MLRRNNKQYYVTSHTIKIDRPSARVISSIGILIMMCGLVDIIVGRAMIMTKRYEEDLLISTALDTWNGVLAVITGVIGLFSRKIKRRLQCFMVSSCIVTVSTATCLILIIVSNIPEVSPEANATTTNETDGFLLATGAGSSAPFGGPYAILCCTYSLQVSSCVIGAILIFYHTIYQTAQPQPEGFYASWTIPRRKRLPSHGPKDDLSITTDVVVPPESIASAITEPDVKAASSESTMYASVIYEEADVVYSCV